MGAMLLAFLGLAGCDGGGSGKGGDPGGDPTPTGDTGPGTGCGGAPSVVAAAGTDETEFITEGAVSMVHGPQGGWHVDAAGVVSGMAAQVSVTPDLYVPALDLTLNPDQAASFIQLASYDAELCSGQFWQARAFLQPDLPDDVQCMQEFVCAHLAGQTLELETTVLDFVDGTTAVGTVSLVLATDVVDQEICLTPADGDSDGDGNRDLCDRCQGYDDQIDVDCDGVPDDCDEQLDEPC